MFQHTHLKEKEISCTNIAPSDPLNVVRNNESLKEKKSLNVKEKITQLFIFSQYMSIK